MLPVSYAVRNLLRTPSRCLQLIVGTALVVLLVLLAAAFQRGMQASLAESGDARNIIMLGAGSEESLERSEVPMQSEGILAGNIAGLATVRGRPAVSGEIVYNGLITVDDNEAQALLRGVTAMAMAVHPQLRVVEGHFPGPGEVMVGLRAHHMLGLPAERLAVGQTIVFEHRSYRIAGRFHAPRSVLAAEIWLDRNELMAATSRDSLSCVIVRLPPAGSPGAASLSDLELFAAQRLDLELVAIDEQRYFGKLSTFFAPLRWMAWLTALLIAAGALFGGLNTLYAAFVARMAELGTLQAIGFPRWMIMASLLQESLIAAFAGGVVAIAMALVLVDGIQVAFSTGVFALTVDAGLVSLALITALALGVVGCLPPAWRCLAPPLPAVLRS